MPPAAFLHPENAPKSLAAGASPQTTLGKLTALPQNPLAGLRGPTSTGREGMGGEERGREERDFGHSQCWSQIDAPVCEKCSDVNRLYFIFSFSVFIDCVMF